MNMKKGSQLVMNIWDSWAPFSQRTVGLNSVKEQLGSVQSKNSWAPFSQRTVGLRSVKEQLGSVQSKNSWAPFSQRTVGLRSVNLIVLLSKSECKYLVGLP